MEGIRLEAKNSELLIFLSYHGTIQELYCDSQLSPSRDEAPDARGRDEDVTLPEYSMNLQFDSETQDEDSR